MSSIPVRIPNQAQAVLLSLEIISKTLDLPFNNKEELKKSIKEALTISREEENKALEAKRYLEQLPRAIADLEKKTELSMREAENAVRLVEQARAEQEKIKKATAHSQIMHERFLREQEEKLADVRTKHILLQEREVAVAAREKAANDVEGKLATRSSQIDAYEAKLRGIGATISEKARGL